MRNFDSAFFMIQTVLINLERSNPRLIACASACATQPLQTAFAVPHFQSLTQGQAAVDHLETPPW